MAKIREQNAENTLSYDAAVIQWITSCHKNRMTTRVIKRWRVSVTPLTTSIRSFNFMTYMYVREQSLYAYTVIIIKTWYNWLSCVGCLTANDSAMAIIFLMRVGPENWSFSTEVL